LIFKKYEAKYVQNKEAFTITSEPRLIKAIKFSRAKKTQIIGRFTQTFSLVLPIENGITHGNVSNLHEEINVRTKIITSKNYSSNLIIFTNTSIFVSPRQIFQYPPS